MSAEPCIDEIYSVETTISFDVLAEVFAVRADLEKFDYGQLYAFAQVDDDNLERRAETAQRFADKIAQKSLDNETIRTILETQQAILPQPELSLIRSGKIADLAFFERYHARMQYLLGKKLQTIYDSGMSGGRAYLIGEVVNTSADWDGILSLGNDKKLAIVRDIATALKFLHDSDIPHGAVRPRSIAFFGADNQATLCAWALIPVLDVALENGGGADMKEAFAFAAPEVLSGSEPKLSSDIYSLGVLMYYLFCGVKPWSQSSTLFGLLEAMQEGGAPYTEQELSLLPEGISAIIRLATIPESINRYENITLMLEDVLACLNGGAPEALKLLNSSGAVDDLPPLSEEEKLENRQKVKEAISVLQETAGEVLGVEDKSKAENSEKTQDGNLTDQKKTDVGGTDSSPVTEKQKPLFEEPQLLEPGSMSAGMEKSGVGTLVLAAVAAAVIVGGVILGYYFFGEKQEPVTVNDMNKVFDDASPAMVKEAVAPQVELVSAVKDEADVAGNATAQVKPSGDDYSALMEAGRKAYGVKDYQAAIDNFEKAVAVNNSSEAVKLLEDSRRLLLQKSPQDGETGQKREAALALAQRMLKVKNLDAAETSVLEVLNYSGNSTDKQALAILNDIRKAKYEQAVVKAEAELAAEKWQDADVSFAWAMSIKGYENDERALAGQKTARFELEKFKKEELAKQQKAMQLKSQYDAAMAEAAAKTVEKRWVEALAAYNLALTIEGYDKDSTALAGIETVKKQGQEEEQARKLQEEEKNKRDFAAQMKIGETLLAAGNWIEAEQVFSNALKIEGFAASTEAQDGRQRAIAGNTTDKNRRQYDSLLKEGFTLLRSGNYKEAEKQFRQALTIKNFQKGAIARQGIMLAETMQKFGAKQKNYLSHIKGGDTLMQSGKYAQAALEYGRAIVLEPKRPEGYIRRGTAYLMGADTEKALENFKQVLAGDPDNFTALSGEVAVYSAMEKFPEVEQSLNDIIAKPAKPEQKVWAQGVLGWLYFNPSSWGGGHRGVRSDNEKAVDLLTAASNAGSATAANNLGVAYESGKGVRRDYKKAGELFEQAAKIGLAEGMFNLGLLYYEGRGVERDYAKALEYFINAAKAGLARASGRVAEMYNRGRGVERDSEKSKEYAAAYGGRTDRDGNCELIGPKALDGKFEDIEKSYPLVGKKELSEQFDSILSEAKILMRDKNFKSAARIAELALMIEGYENNQEARDLVASARQGQKTLETQVAVVVAESNKPQKQDGSVAAEGEGQAGKTGIDTASLPPEVTVDKAVGNDSLPSLNAQKIKIAGVGDQAFKVYYDDLMKEATRLLGLKHWGFAEQAYRVALALPGNLDDGGAVAGLKAAMTEKRQAVSDGRAKYTDYEAVMNNAATTLREGQWPQAIHLFNYAMSIDGFKDNKVAQLGLAAAMKAVEATAVKPDVAPLLKGDERDTASYNTALKQAQEFMSQKKFQAAEQMADIILSMKGFENDQTATLLKSSARMARLQNENTPEAVAIKRQKHKAAYDQLILTGKVHAQNGDKDKAIKALELVFKLPGYENDAETKKLLVQIEGGAAPVSAVEVSPQQRAQYMALMQRADQALGAGNWVKAEETYRIVLQITGFEADQKARSGLEKALVGQGKSNDMPPVPVIDKKSGVVEDLTLTEGFITEGDDVSALKHKAEFEALMREGRRQYELMQFEVAEAVFLEALKIKGYGNNPEAVTLLAQAKANKPIAAEVKAPDHKGDNDITNPRQEMRQQAALLMQDGNRLRSQGKLKAALQAYASGIDLDRDNPQLIINRGDTYAALGQFDLALSDYNKALKLTSIGAEQQSYAWNNIANVYYYGKKDFATALDYYKKSAQGGSAAAMNSLGVCYGFGRGVDKDPTKALEWYKSAAALNYGNAMLNLGLLYQNGWGVAVDNQKALEWYLKAAQRNVPRAYARVALMYREGLGVDKDESKAEEYSDKAKKLGYTKER